MDPGRSVQRKALVVVVVVVVLLQVQEAEAAAFQWFSRRARWLASSCLGPPSRHRVPLEVLLPGGAWLPKWMARALVPQSVGLLAVYHHRQTDGFPVRPRQPQLELLLPSCPD